MNDESDSLNSHSSSLIVTMKSRKRTKRLKTSTDDECRLEKPKKQKKAIKKSKFSLWNEIIEPIVNAQNEMDSFLQMIKCTDVVSCFKKEKILDDKVQIDCLFNICRDCTSGCGNNEECRFLGWRKLKWNHKTESLIFQIEELGFLDESDAKSHDRELWEYDTQNQLIQDDYLKTRILNLAKSSFKELIEYEFEMREKLKNGTRWKRFLKDTRELCDKCKTSIFNGHLACLHCGYSICLKCYEEGLSKFSKLNINNFDCSIWDDCIFKDYSNDLKYRPLQNFHKPDDIVYVQFIPHYILKCIYTKFESFFQNKPVSISNQNIDANDNDSELLFLDAKYDQSKFETKESFEKNLFEVVDREWLKKRPILIKNVHLNMNSNLWTPKSFMETFLSENPNEDEKLINLINCRNGRVVVGQKMSTFWRGFEDYESRERDLQGRPIIFKLKDWPTSDDFEKVLKSRFDDLMQNIPIKEFTQRNGALNMASYLPSYFCKPDLGPKMYIAYSSADTPKEGTTNLHLDISDAVNIMMYVGGDAYIGSDSKHSQTDDSNSSINQSTNKNKKKKLTHKINDLDIVKNNNLNKEIYDLLLKTKCDQVQLDRFLNGEKPGALWHIFKPADSDKIRDYFSINSLMKGKKLKGENDAIHDQTNYIDNKILDDLIEKFQIEKPFTIIQYLGDAIFIPAGAPHQVRNLNSCIKVAGDFVTPHGIDQCLKITNEFRYLSDKHSNKEDKLQVKNILYHTIKQCLNK